jgi:hypothetical protein
LTTQIEYERSFKKAKKLVRQMDPFYLRESREKNIRNFEVLFSLFFITGVPR